MAKEASKIETEKPKERERTKGEKKPYILAVGKRKGAVARVRLYIESKEDVFWGEQKMEKGKIFVNGLPIDEYFPYQSARAMYEEPFRLTNMLEKHIVTIKVAGGGKMGQLAAAIHGISRAIMEVDTEKHRSILKKKGYLVRDARVRERRKVGTGGKARRAKQSPKR